MVTDINLGFKKTQDLLVSKRCDAAAALSPNDVKTAVCPVNSNETIEAVKAYVSAPSVTQAKLIEHGNELLKSTQA